MDLFLDFPQVQTVDPLMDRQSKSASLPLTSQHLVVAPQPDFGWEETYKKLDFLGRGGCAEVFKALHKRSGEHVALKVSKVRTPAEYWADLDVLKGAKMRMAPRDDNPLSKQSWWVW